MKITLKFKNIVDAPLSKIWLNDTILFNEVVKEQIDIVSEAQEHCVLVIEHYNKLPSETIVENGVIIRDRSFELESIKIDGYDLAELIWQSKFTADNGTEYQSCLFFGPNGKFTLEFDSPILKWILGSRHQKNNDDPNWEEDYNYYTKACQILSQI